MPCSSSRGARRRNPAPRPGAGRVRLSKPPRGPDGSGSPPARLRASGLLQLSLRRRLSAALSGADGVRWSVPDRHPRTVLEIPPSADRLERILHLLGECAFSLHDLSRVEVSPRGLPRFNMPFELGLAAVAGEPGRAPGISSGCSRQGPTAAAFSERSERLRSVHPSWPTGWRVRGDVRHLHVAPAVPDRRRARLPACPPGADRVRRPSSTAAARSTRRTGSRRSSPRPRSWCGATADGSRG